MSFAYIVDGLPHAPKVMDSIVSTTLTRDEVLKRNFAATMVLADHRGSPYLPHVVCFVRIGQRCTARASTACPDHEHPLGVTF